MIFKNSLINFRNRYPRTFRKISFDALKISNFTFYFFFLPVKLIVLVFLNFKLAKSSKIKKVIIRNDKIGDCILTLPFIYGYENGKQNFYFSLILDKLIDELDIKCNWKSSIHIDKKSDLIIANLSTTKILNFKELLIRSKSSIIFTQLGINPLSKRGYPLIFSPNYLKNKSQTFFIKNCFKLLQIDSDPIKGLKILNNHIKNIKKLKKENLIIIVVGFGLDNARKLTNKYIKEIVNFSKNKSLKPILLEEPGFNEKTIKLAKKIGIKSKSCNNFSELFILFKNSKYVIGYDCGPMHIASLVTNSITLFSHTPSMHWGVHYWHKFVYKKKFKNEKNEIQTIRQYNKGSNKNNWIICLDNKGCPLHKNICTNNNCSKYNQSLFKKSLKSILDEFI